MITEGFIREMHHISNYFNTPVNVVLKYLGKEIEAEVFSRYVTINYKGNKIWEECIDEELGNFGVESIQHIFFIVDKIEKGEEWEDLAFYEKPQDLNKFYKEEALKFREELIQLSEKNAHQHNDNNPQEEQVQEKDSV